MNRLSSNPAKRTPEEQEAMDQIRVEMARRKMAVHEMAAQVGYSEHYLHKVIDGTKKSRRARGAIERFLGVNFWGKL